MSLEQREASLRTFEEDGDVAVMLTSLKCGGVGLNLTGLSLKCWGLILVANRVICLDLWWNWQIENQAIDRYVLQDHS
jgi:SNF2 family DNA or RNA helicase